MDVDAIVASLCVFGWCESSSYMPNWYPTPKYPEKSQICVRYLGVEEHSLSQGWQRFCYFQSLNTRYFCSSSPYRHTHSFPYYVAILEAQLCDYLESNYLEEQVLFENHQTWGLSRSWPGIHRLEFQKFLWKCAGWGSQVGFNQSKHGRNLRYLE